MNSIGRLFRVHLYGESHGLGVGLLIDGCPAGLALSADDFAADVARRRSGKKGTTPRSETDAPLLESGVFEGHTTGAPILIRFLNADTDSSSYEKMRDTPRPGHADFVALQKFGGYADYRGGGHFSGRMTLPLVAAGVVAKKILSGTRIVSTLIEAGGSTHIDAAVEQALADGDSIGGVVECRVSGLPPALGEPFFDSLESALAHAAFSIPAVKGVEFGSGFQSAKMHGSECNDAIVDPSGRTATNHAGGANGGLTNGNDLVFRIAVKPTSSIRKTKETVHMKTGERVSLSVEGRHDACIALRVPPVLEAVTAIVLADFFMLEGLIPRRLNEKK